MAIYRIMQFLAAPFVLAGLLLRLVRGKESRASLQERLSLGDVTQENPTLWVHGASLGELTAAQPLIRAIQAEFPATTLVVTANSETARAMIAPWQNERLIVRNAPLDLPGPVRRFIRKMRPAAAIILENELWPEKITQCARNGVPVLVVGARMSAQSARQWQRFRGLAHRVIGSLTHVAPLDDASRERFRALGLPSDRLGPNVNLKAGVALQPPAPDDLAALAGHFPRETTFLAASTHEGEEKPILQAFAQALKTRPDLRLILAPRHPKRAREIAQLLEKMQLSYSRRGNGQAPAPDSSVYLADTIGEMALWYSLAGTTIIGGSFAPKGGHTPVEPVQFASLVVHGPDVRNHRALFQALHDADAAREVSSPEMLVPAFTDPPAPEAAQGMRERASRAIAKLNSEQSGIGETIALLREATANRTPRK